MERTRLLRRPLVWIVLVIAGAIALSYLISGGPSYAKWDTSSVLVHLRNGDTKSVQIDDKEQTLKLVLKPESDPYGHLNIGQQSMNWRNRLRGAIRKGLEVGGVKVTLDLVKEVRDTEGLVTEPTPPKPAKTVKPAAEADAQVKEHVDAAA